MHYTFRPFYLPMYMKYKIKNVKEKEYFIGEQTSGFFDFWNHLHKFTPIENGVIVEDVISYKNPFGLFGKAINMGIVLP